MSLIDIRPALVARLLGDSSITDLIGGSGDDARIYPVKLRQGVKDTSIVYSRVSGLGDHHMGGPSGLSRPRLQIDCWASSADAAQTLADLVKERLDGFSGDIEYGDSSPQTVAPVQGIFFETEREDYNDVMKMYRVSRDYLIWFEESAGA